MKKSKAILSALLVMTAMLAAAGCGSGSSSSSYSNPMDEGKKKTLTELAKESGMLTGELENKNIKWLATWDINPDGTGKKTPAELALFQEIYGGNIEWIQCTHEERFTKLSEGISAGEGYDFFYTGDMDAFPKCVVSKYFVSSDDYIDFNSDLWKDVSASNDQLLWGGKHYLAVTQATGDKVAVVYNRKTVQEAGLEDPAKLYERGEWTWDAFENMLEKFVDTKNKRYGIDGWWFQFGLINTVGVPPVGIEDGKLKSYLDTEEMERVQNWIYELGQKDYIAIGHGDYDWVDKPQYIGEGKLLFYPVGLYEFYKTKDQWTEKFGADVAFVPMPKDPKADGYYLPVGMESYGFISGGQNPQGVAKYLDCKRFCILNDQAREIADSIFIDDFGWTQEMVNMRNDMNRLANEHPVFDLATGVSEDCGKLLDDMLRATSRGTPWSETLSEIDATVKKYISDVNEKA